VVYDNSAFFSSLSQLLWELAKSVAHYLIETNLCDRRNRERTCLICLSHGIVCLSLMLSVPLMDGFGLMSVATKAKYRERSNQTG
jgi:hypothetical protein